MIGYDEGTSLGYDDARVIGPILGNVDGITIGLDVETELVS